jgi:hypothetical protein
MSREKAHVSEPRCRTRTPPCREVNLSEATAHPTSTKPTRKRTGYYSTRRAPRQRSAGRRAHNASRGVADGVFRVFAVALERALASVAPRDRRLAAVAAFGVAAGVDSPRVKAPAGGVRPGRHGEGRRQGRRRHDRGASVVSVQGGRDRRARGGSRRERARCGEGFRGRRARSTRAIHGTRARVADEMVARFAPRFGVRVVFSSALRDPRRPRPERGGILPLPASHALDAVVRRRVHRRAALRFGPRGVPPRVHPQRRRAGLPGAPRVSVRLDARKRRVPHDLRHAQDPGDHHRERALCSAGGI